jgi:anti-sigma-K factor RskA
MTNINDPWRDDEVTRLLKDLPEVEPPSSLVQDVMSTVSSRAATRATHPPAISSKRGKTMAKKVLWIVAAAAAAALIVMRFAGYPPVEKGTEATIGAAQRYQAPQISTADV